MNTIKYPFEEVPTIVDGEWVAGRVSGFAEISYSDDGEWYVSALAIEHDNDGRGTAAKAKLISVSPTYAGPIWIALSNALETLKRGYIQEKVDAALLADGISFQSADAEHRLRGYELV